MSYATFHKKDDDIWLLNCGKSVYFHLLPTVVLRGIAQYDDNGGVVVGGVVLVSGVPRAE